MDNCKSTQLFTYSKIKFSTSKKKAIFASANSGFSHRRRECLSAGVRRPPNKRKKS